MKTIGLIGGMSWESTVTYYKVINQGVKERLGGFHSAKCLLHSVDFAEIERRQRAGQWDEVGDVLAAAAKGLEDAGADLLLICTNTMHKVAGQVEGAVSIPLLHIADATADALQARGIGTVGLLGTRYTMEQDFYKSRLAARGLQVLAPGEDARTEMNRIIFEELCLGEISEESRKKVLGMITGLESRGAQGVILGCTEIGLLVKQDDTPVALFDTTEIHARRAVELALEGVEPDETL